MIFEFRNSYISFSDFIVQFEWKLEFRKWFQTGNQAPYYYSYNNNQTFLRFNESKWKYKTFESSF